MKLLEVDFALVDDIQQSLACQFDEFHGGRASRKGDRNAVAAKKFLSLGVVGDKSMSGRTRCR
jgi:hypothetical protein